MKTANSKPGDISQSDKGPVVRISNGSLYINGQIIWQNVNLEVNPGEFIAILGPNGSGKSSLVKAILGSSSSTQARSRYSANRQDAETPMWDMYRSAVPSITASASAGVIS